MAASAESPACRHLVSPAEDDALAVNLGATGWTPEMQDNFERLVEIRPTRRAAVVVTVRDEGVSLLEWIAHHRTLGFEGIFVYTNNNRDGSDALLALLARHGVITLIDNRTSSGVLAQRKAYEHSLHLLTALRDYEWVYYADADELLVLAPQYGNRIDAVLDTVGRRFPERPPSAVCYFWKWFVSGCAYERTPGLMLTRFRHCRPHDHFKSIVRLRDVLSMKPVHFPWLRVPGFFVDAGLQPLGGTAAMHEMRDLTRDPPAYDGGHIRHYWTKSFQEFAVKKHRGNCGFDHPFARFFDWNGPETDENLDPPDPALAAAVAQEVTLLRALPGVAATEARIEESFADLLAVFGGDTVLRAIHQEEMRAREAPAG